MPKIKVAAVQVSSINAEGERNLRNAEPFVQEAAESGAELVLLPEFLAAGYIYDESIWQSGEPRGGLTESWLGRTASEHKVYLGATYLEAEGDEFYNTFALAKPDGSIAGRVRKKSLPFFEGWFFKPCNESKIIETDLGRIGVGICNDNQGAWLYNHFVDEKPDLILMPHSAPTPSLPLIDNLFRPAYTDKLKDIPQQFARALGVPVVMANKSATQSESPLPGVPLVKVPFNFEGYSAVCDRDGRLLESLVGKEGALVHEVEAGFSKSEVPRAEHFYWSFGPKVIPDAMGRLLQGFELAGQTSYRLSAKRKQMARQCVGASGDLSLAKANI